LGAVVSKTVALFNVDTEQAIGTLPNPWDQLQGLNTVSFNKDGSALAVEGDHYFYVYRMDTRQPVYGGGCLGPVVWDPAKPMLAEAESNAIQLWDWIPASPAGPASIHSHEILNTSVPLEPSAPIFSPDGSLIAAATQAGTIEIWDIDTLKHVSTLTVPGAAGLTVPGGAGPMAFSPNGKQLAAEVGSAFISNIGVWDLHTPRNVALIKGRQTDASKGTSPVDSLSFSPDGSLIATGGLSELAVWDVTKQKQVALLDPNDTILSIIWTQKNEIVTGGVDHIGRWQYSREVSSLG
jgi:WD40 repeat protein